MRASMSSLKDLWAAGATVIFTFLKLLSSSSPVFFLVGLVLELVFARTWRWARMRRMYSTVHSIPVRVEWPTGRVLGPVRRKRFGKEGTETLSCC
jgi:ABC-type dipeptide/oligopeptide/nickel transport system permease component